MRRNKHEMMVRRLLRHGSDDHSLSRWDGRSTIKWSDGCDGMNSTITHELDGTEQARYGGETAVKA